MKKIIVMAVAGIALAGCATTTPAPTVTVTPPPVTVTPTPEPQPLTDEELFIAQLEGEYGPISPGKEQALIDGAYDLCVSFDTIGVKQTIVTLVNSVTTGREAKAVGYFTGAATTYFCPEYMPQLEKIFGINSVSA
jgi:hypothetical protein